MKIREKCSETDCPKPVFAREKCSSHYQRDRRNAQLGPLTKKGKPRVTGPARTWGEGAESVSTRIRSKHFAALESVAKREHKGVMYELAQEILELYAEGQDEFYEE